MFDILLLRAEYLVELWQDEGRLKRRQDLPQSAFYTESLAIRTVIVISYPWLHRDHPDPDGWHLGILGRLLELFCSNFGAAAVFLDYCSLYQPGRDESGNYVPRSAWEEQRFRESLNHLQVLYAHQQTWVWVTRRRSRAQLATLVVHGTPSLSRLFRSPRDPVRRGRAQCLKSMPPDFEGLAYDERGWTTFEAAISSWIKPSSKLIDISKLAPPAKVPRTLSTIGHAARPWL